MDHRNSTTGENIALLVQLSTPELQHWLTRFILVVRKKNGDDFPARKATGITGFKANHKAFYFSSCSQTRIPAAYYFSLCSSVTINITPKKL